MTKVPDYHHHEEYQNRLRKLEEIRQVIADPYPAKYQPTHHSKLLHEQFGHLNVGTSEGAMAESTEPVCIAGRLVLFRSMGKNAFAHIQDESGRIQIMFNRTGSHVKGYVPLNDEESNSDYKFIEKKIDLGDILGIKGFLFKTQKGELTIFVKELTLLSKTLLPLADKHGGLIDKELRYRKRWLDLISHPETLELFRKRSLIIEHVRSFLQAAKFLEVETPILQSLYGGAEARPFVTRLKALDQQMFLRISLEIPLKKLIVGGIERIFEIGRVFRNEGIDRTHNPEFTLLEAYAAYWDYEDLMKFVETLFEQLAIKLYGSTLVPHTLQETNETIFIDMKAPWKRLSMKESLQEYAGLNVDQLSDAEIKKLLKESDHCDLKKLENLSRGLLIAALFEVKVESHLIQPHHIIDHPIETTPLCKPHRDPQLRKQGLVERFESFIVGKEICNAYSELNDPILQRELLEQQAERKERGDEEANPLDEEFIEAICQGLPPTGGVGIGLDRLIMLMTNSHSIRDVLYFPWMK